MHKPIVHEVRTSSFHFPSHSSHSNFVQFHHSIAWILCDGSILPVFFFSRGRYNEYIDLLFTVFIGEIKFYEITTPVFWFHWVTKPIVKNKLWFGNLCTRYPVRVFVFIWLLVFGIFNYYHIYRKAGVQKGKLKYVRFETDIIHALWCDIQDM